MNPLKMTFMVNALSIFKIPLLAFITPRIVEMSDDRVVVRVRLDRRTQNHLGVMYFGALAMGAELSVATRALQAISDSGRKIDFIFKDFQCDFLKRADGHVHFICNESRAIASMIESAVQDGERHSQTFEGTAHCPDKSDEPVMKYKVTLSVKRRK
jgi:acyl-coenzyme A thioesterase PaaI-like protein